jgi:hypothetical protein
MHTKGFAIIFGLLFGVATLVIMTIFASTSYASQPLVPVPNLSIKSQILPSPSIRTIDILIHINSSLYELQKFNTTGALAQLDIATQEISRVTQTLWVIHEELLGIAQDIKGQNLGSNDIHGNYLINSNQAGMEPNGYNALVNIIMARQDIINGNLKGAQIELDGATQAVTQFSKLLTFTAYRLDSINSGWSYAPLVVDGK